mgnify:CR=1 FL=1
MSKYIYTTFLLVLIFVSCKTDNKKTFDTNLTTKIAFGSCGSQNHELPIFNNVVSHQPDLFIFLGDNN